MTTYRRDERLFDPMNKNRTRAIGPTCWTGLHAYTLINALTNLINDFTQSYNPSCVQVAAKIS